MENPLLSPVAEVLELDTSAIWTVRYLDPSGFECQLSLEGSSGVEVLKKAESAIERLKQTQSSPVTRSTPTSLAKDIPKKETQLCSVHNVEMRRWEKNGKVWYAHKFNDHWCRGK